MASAAERRLSSQDDIDELIPRDKRM